MCSPILYFTKCDTTWKRLRNNGLLITQHCIEPKRDVLEHKLMFRFSKRLANCILKSLSLFGQPKMQHNTENASRDGMGQLGLFDLFLRFSYFFDLSTYKYYNFLKHFSTFSSFRTSQAYKQTCLIDLSARITGVFSATPCLTTCLLLSHHNYSSQV